MAADLGLVMDAAQAHAGKLAAHALGNGMGDGRLAHARRAHQADDLPLDVGVQLAHGQNFQDALLDLVQAVMVMVQHLAGMGLIQVIFGGHMPGQRQAGIQIIADDAGLGRVALHAGQALALFQQLFLALGVQLELQDLLAVGVGLGAGVLTVAQLLADGVHLLAQIVFPLAFVHLDVDLLVDVLFDGKDVTLAVQQHQQLFQPAQQGGLVEHRLLVLILEQ